MLTQQQIVKSIKYYENHEKSKEYTRINKTKYRRKNRELLKEKERKRKEYKYSWGGDARSNNNLLSIDPNLFQ